MVTCRAEPPGKVSALADFIFAEHTDKANKEPQAPLNIAIVLLQTPIYPMA